MTKLPTYVNKRESAQRIRAEFPEGQTCCSSRDGESCSLQGCPQIRNNDLDWQNICPLAAEEDDW